MAAGGALSVLGPVLAFFIDALGFDVSALLFSRLPRIAPEREPLVPRPRLFRGLADAWAVVWPHARATASGLRQDPIFPGSRRGLDRAGAAGRCAPWCGVGRLGLGLLTLRAGSARVSGLPS
ncbi:MAG: hypothetical protein KUG77_09390 [Nannocystaceae bacterium]|nr:hypothetical protein [Nannocystaceae bacterium]